MFKVLFSCISALNGPKFKGELVKLEELAESEVERLLNLKAITPVTAVEDAVAAVQAVEASPEQTQAEMLEGAAEKALGAKSKSELVTIATDLGIAEAEKLAKPALLAAIKATGS